MSWRTEYAASADAIVRSRSEFRGGDNPPFAQKWDKPSVTFHLRPYEVKKSPKKAEKGEKDSEKREKLLKKGPK